MSKYFVINIYKKTFYEKLVDTRIFIMYLNFKFHIPLPKQFISDTMVAPLFLLIVYFVIHMKRNSH